MQQCLIKVEYADIRLQHAPLGAELMEAVRAVIEHGKFILGPEVETFEKEFAATAQTRFALAVNSGTDALIIALKALKIGPGDEVITTSNTFVTTVSAIVLAGAIPVYVDVLDDYTIDPQAIEKAITGKTRAIIPVHLTGQPANMDRVMAIAGKHRLKVVEDAAQAVSAEIGGRRVGSFGDIGCFSLHVLKTLNACGDGGVVVTDDEKLYAQMKLFRENGCPSRDDCVVWSGNSRMDTVQAAMLLVKLKHMEEWTQKRIKNAAFYQTHLSNVSGLKLPRPQQGIRAVYHTFVVQAEDRDVLRKFLLDNGIKTKIHYPTPVHQQTAGREFYKAGMDLARTEDQAKKILSLPVHQDLTEDQLSYVVGKIKEFYQQKG